MIVQAMPYPAAPVGATDPHFANVVFLSGFEGANGSTAFTDESSKAHPITAFGNAQISTVEKQFGASSVLLDGSGDYLSVPDSDDWDFGSGEFTIEMWRKLNTTNGDYTIIAQYPASSAARGWALYSFSSVLRFRFYDAAGSTRDVAFAETKTINWTHFAIDRDAAGAVRLYSGGAMAAKATNPQTFRNSTGPLLLGRREDGAVADLNGHLDEVRITKGVARYASDAGFTPPTAAFPRS